MKGVISMKAKGKIFVLLCFMVAALSFGTMSTYAATKTVKEISYGAKKNTVAEKATKVKKGKTTLIVSQGWAKFKAPKTKTYTFTLSNVASMGVNPASDINNGYFVLGTFKGKYFWSKRIKQNGKKVGSAYVCTPYSWSLQSESVKANPTGYTSLPSRSAKLKVRKGGTIYLYFWFVKKPVSAVLTIK
jgi:hypothetical protein